MKTEIVLMIVWAILAIASFVLSFSCPFLPKLVGLVFGCYNLAMIVGLVLGYITERKHKEEDK